MSYYIILYYIILYILFHIILKSNIIICDKESFSKSKHFIYFSILKSFHRTLYFIICKYNNKRVIFKYSISIIITFKLLFIAITLLL